MEGTAHQAQPHLRIVARTARRRVTSEPIEGVARIVQEGPLVRRLQTEKYGWQKWLIEKAYDLSMLLARKPAVASVYLEVVPATGKSDVAESLVA